MFSKNIGNMKDSGKNLLIVAAVGVFEFGFLTDNFGVGSKA
jgi:hypothetical protein